MFSTTLTYAPDYCLLTLTLNYQKEAAATVLPQRWSELLNLTLKIAPFFLSLVYLSFSFTMITPASQQLGVCKAAGSVLQLASAMPMNDSAFGAMKEE